MENHHHQMYLYLCWLEPFLTLVRVLFVLLHSFYGGIFHLLFFIIFIRPLFKGKYIVNV